MSRRVCGKEITGPVVYENSSCTRARAASARKPEVASRVQVCHQSCHVMLFDILQVMLLVCNMNHWCVVTPGAHKRCRRGAGRQQVRGRERHAPQQRTPTERARRRESEAASRAGIARRVLQGPPRSITSSTQAASLTALADGRMRIHATTLATLSSPDRHKARAQAASKSPHAIKIEPMR